MSIGKDSAFTVSTALDGATILGPTISLTKGVIMKHLLYIALVLNLTACAGAEIMARSLGNGLTASAQAPVQYTNYGPTQYGPKTQVCTVNALHQLVCTEQ
jgi:hypothetical protein